MISLEIPRALQVLPVGRHLTRYSAGSFIRSAEKEGLDVSTCNVLLAIANRLQWFNALSAMGELSEQQRNLHAANVEAARILVKVQGSETLDVEARHDPRGWALVVVTAETTNRPSCSIPVPTHCY